MRDSSVSVQVSHTFHNLLHALLIVSLILYHHHYDNGFEKTTTKHPHLNFYFIFLQMTGICCSDGELQSRSISLDCPRPLMWTPASHAELPPHLYFI